MVRSWKKRLFAAAVVCTFMLMTACGTLPKHYPGVEEDPVVIEMGDRFKVNFFFQNNENTYCIRPNGVAKNFFEALTQTFSVMSYSDVSKTYVLDYNPAHEQYGIVEYDRNRFDNLTWENAKDVYGVSGKKKEDKNSFFVLNGKNGIDKIAGESRVNGGILRIFTDEVKRKNVLQFSSVPQNNEDEEHETMEAETQESLPDMGESFFDPNAINVIFTDLSEKNITYLGDDLYNYYTADNRYNACVMAIKLEMEKNNIIYYASKDNANALTSNSSGDSRWFYLLMVGPSTDLAVFVQKLTVNLQSLNIKEGTQVGGYELSDLSFTSENFDVEQDIVSAGLSASDESQQQIYNEQGADGLFESAIVRLERAEGKDSVFPVGIFRDSIIEYRYHNDEKAFWLKGYQGANTKDFALNIDLTKEVMSYDLVADTTELSYVFGEPVIYEPGKEGWILMDPDHRERFFKKVSVDENDGKHLCIISDNADECGVHDIYVTVPILQKATISQVVGDQEGSTTAWVINDCSVKTSDASEEVKRTYYFDKFYINLFDMQIAGARDENNNIYEGTKDVYAQIDELKILIEDIH